jgi:hypothetical protein
MRSDPHLDASRRAGQLAGAVRRATAAMDAQVAPGLSGDLMRAATLLAVSAAQLASTRNGRLLSAALGATDELETLLVMAAALELLGARGPSLTAEVRGIRELLRAARRRHQQGAQDAMGGSAA